MSAPYLPRLESWAAWCDDSLDALTRLAEHLREYAARLAAVAEAHDGWCQACGDGMPCRIADALRDVPK